MADVESELQERFAPPGAALAANVLAELLHMVNLFSIDPQDLFFKWESYVQKMGVENTHLSAKTARDFKKDMQDALERESRSKGHTINNPIKRPVATPRAASGNDVFGMLDGMVSATPASKSTAAAKRKAHNFSTPAPKSAKSVMNSSPADQRASDTLGEKAALTFSLRQNAGKVEECINEHLPSASSTSQEAHDKVRVKLKTFSDQTKFSYKPMAMKLSEASEILDDRIDIFTDLVQKKYSLEDNAFGNPAAQSSADIVAVGRIACDQPNGKLNAASLVLETSRRMGAGIRVPLKLEGLAFDLFPGKIVALRGSNVSGEYFAVTEVLPMPSPPTAISTVAEMEAHHGRLGSSGDDGIPGALSMLVGSGPYTMESDLSFEPLQALLDKAAEIKTDVLILTGPFIDLEHPIIASGDIEDHLPPDAKIQPDRTTLTDVFRVLVGNKLQALAQTLPSITIVLVPSMRDAISKHVAWPQDRFARQNLGLPKQAVAVTNPITLGINEMVIAITTQDVLSELRRENVHQSGKGQSSHEDFLARLSASIIEQQHFFPLFPPQARENLPTPAAIPGEVVEHGEEARCAVGTSLDLGYLKLGEFPQSPDLLILPSILSPFTKVVDGVVVVNPGTLSKRRAAGTYAAFNIQPLQLSDADREAGQVTHELFARARVEVTKI